MVFIEAGRDQCSNCMLLKNTIIPMPETSASLGAAAVGYYDDVDRTPYSDAFNALQRNLPSAGSLPLCGFFTPDMQWIHGFSGHTDASHFRQQIATASASYRRIAAVDETQVPAGAATPPTFPDSELASVPAASAGEGEIDLGMDLSAEPRVAPAMDMAPATALAPYVPPVAAPPTAPPVQDPAFVEPAAPPAPPAVVQPPVAPPTVVVPPSAPTPIAPPETTVPPVAPPAAEAPASPAASVPSGVAPPPGDESPRDALRRAAAALATRDFAKARSILSTVKVQARGTPEGREADKGEVAIYGLRRVDAASGAQRAAIAAQARQDLQGTVWASLFE
jgi:hypothetical protein